MIKSLNVIAAAIAVLLMITGCFHRDDSVVLKLATTTSVYDSGLIGYLRPYLLEEENIKLDVLPQGSNQAIKTASDGNCDVLIAHSPILEQEFVASGKGFGRREFAYNYFVITGPAKDIAKVAESRSAAEGFTRIYSAYTDGMDCIFYSRDDKSGTDIREKSIWEEVSLDVSSFSSGFYKKTGSGMLNTLIVSNNTDGYTLTDKSTFIANREKLTHLRILLEEKDDLINIYSVTLVGNSKKYGDAKRFSDWLLKGCTQKRISEYGINEYGEALFFTGREVG